MLPVIRALLSGIYKVMANHIPVGLINALMTLNLHGADDVDLMLATLST
jgi:hypothetical protein